MLAFSRGSRFKQPESRTLLHLSLTTLRRIPCQASKAAPHSRFVLPAYSCQPMKRERDQIQTGAPRAKRLQNDAHKGYEIVMGDLLVEGAQADVIAHQCNCVTLGGRGLYTALVAKYPYCDVYSRRRESSSRPRLGSLEVCEPENGTLPKIACLYAQLGPGKPGQASKKYGVKASADSAAKRLEYFNLSLDALAEAATVGDWKQVAFPYNIGCGLAGGDWTAYSAALRTFAARLPATRVCLYKKQ